MIFLKDTDIFKLRRMDFEIWRRRMLIGILASSDDPAKINRGKSNARSINSGAIGFLFLWY